MTTITGNVNVGTGVPPSALGTQPSVLLVRSRDLVTTSLGVTMLPVESRVPIAADGSFSFSVPPLPDGFAYEFIFSVNGGRWVSSPRYCTVPASGSIAYSELTEVSTPGHAGWTQPGWVATILDFIASGGGGGGGGGPVAWGAITGIMASQSDLASALALLAPKASPVLTGNPTAPTPAPGDNDTSIATTAFVANAIAALISSAPGALDTLAELAAALGDDANFAANVTNAIALKAADNAVVKLTGAQSIAGVKTFEAAPVVPDAAFAIAKVIGLTAALAGRAGAATPDAAIGILTQSAYDALSSKPATTVYFTI